MRIPLEYGDNFPVLTGGWNPAVPWKFPQHGIDPRRRGWFSRLLPWLTLGLGMTLGILWMKGFEGPPAPASSQVPPAMEKTEIVRPEPVRIAPAGRPIRLRSRLA